LILRVGGDLYFSCKIDKDCYIHYHKSFTPSILNISPQNFYAGSEIQFRISPKEVSKNLLSEIKIGRNICAPTFDRYFSYQSKSNTYFNCFVGDAKPEIISDFMLNHFTGFPSVSKSLYRDYINSEIFNFTENYNSKTNQNDYAINNFDNNANIKRLFPQTDKELYDKSTKQNTHVFKIFPSISSLGTTEISPSGKNIIIVKGKGFSASKELTKVFIDNQENPCLIRSINSEEITCETEKLNQNLIDKTTKFTNVKEIPEFKKFNSIIFPGSPGLSYNLYSPKISDDEYFTNPSNYKSKIIKSDIYLETSSKYHQSEYESFSEYFTGYFKAPVTTQYKFYISSDNYAFVFLWINDIRTKIIDFRASSNPEDFISNPTQYSTWTHLVGGNVYYFEIIHHKSESMDHMTLGVEIKNPKYLTTKSRLLLGLEDENLFEKLKKSKLIKYFIDKKT